MSGAEAVLWLALNIFYEARGEPLVDKMAVAHVTLNRAHVCGDDVYDTVRHKSAFSWTAEQHLKIPLEPGNKNSVRVFSRCLVAAQRAIKSYDFTGGATYYHLENITPYWVISKQRTGKWGKHIFYRGSPKDREFCVPPLIDLPSAAPPSPPNRANPPPVKKPVKSRLADIKSQVKAIADRYRNR